MDAEYLIDCASSLGELTALEHVVLLHPDGCYWEVARAVDANEHVDGPWLVNEARKRLTQLSTEMKHYFALCSLPAVGDHLEAFLGRAEHLVQQKVQSDLGHDSNPLPRLYPELGSVLNEALFKTEQDVSEGLIRLVLERVSGAALDRWCEDLNLVRQAVSWYREGNQDVFAAMSQAKHLLKPTALPPEVATFIKKQKHREKQQARDVATRAHRAKAAIKKASKLFMNLGRDTSLRMFVSGQEVTLSHPDSNLKFVVKPLNESGWLIERTQTGRSHTPYELSVYSKEDVFLAHLCVYFKETPVLDQLLALTMYIESGNELALLEKANWFSTGGWTQEHTLIMLTNRPTLKNKIPLRESSEDNQPMLATRSMIAVNPEFIRLQDVWEPFKGRVTQWIRTWAEPVVCEGMLIQESIQSLRLAHSTPQITVR